MYIYHPMIDIFNSHGASYLYLTYAYVLLYIRLVFYRLFSSHEASVHIPMDTYINLFAFL